jgi:hypothetical protein
MTAEPEPRFPMQGGPTIDWQTAREIYARYSDVYGTSQSLERIAERGGFGWSEVEKIWEAHTRWRIRRLSERP